MPNTRTTHSTNRRPAAIALWLLLASLANIGPARAAGQTAGLCTGAGASATTLHVTVTGARSQAGNITLTLYGSDPAAFLAHRGSIFLTRVPLSATGAEACFALSMPGFYAVAVYHDENDNHHFDRTLIGLPAEGYGFSNDAPIRLGPPSFASARLLVRPGDTRIAIRLRY